MDLNMGNVIPRCNLKRKRDPEIFDEIVVEETSAQWVRERNL
jgi:hypothetical protein